jgi:hypothetical protein
MPMGRARATRLCGSCSAWLSISLRGNCAAVPGTARGCETPSRAGRERFAIWPLARCVGSEEMVRACPQAFADPMHRAGRVANRNLFPRKPVDRLVSVLRPYHRAPTILRLQPPSSRGGNDAGRYPREWKCAVVPPMASLRSGAGRDSLEMGFIDWPPPAEMHRITLCLAPARGTHWRPVSRGNLVLRRDGSLLPQMSPESRR